MDTEVTIRDEQADEADVVDELVGEAFGGRPNEVGSSGVYELLVSR